MNNCEFKNFGVKLLFRPTKNNYLQIGVLGLLDGDNQMGAVTDLADIFDFDLDEQASDDDEEAENSGDFGYDMDDIEDDDGDDDDSGSDEPSIDEDALDDDNDHNNLLGYVLSIEAGFEAACEAAGADPEADCQDMFTAEYASIKKTSTSNAILLGV